MKKIAYLYRTLTLFIAFCGLNACSYEIVDIDKVPETMTLQASSGEIALDVEHLTDDIITFTWEPARSTSEDHVVLYTTKLDVIGNNFGSSTAIMQYEDDGIFSRSFTSEQLQNWANEKWKLPVNTPFTLEFRVIAQWEGGPTFEAPEVKTVTVRVQPIRTIVFDADNVFLDGSSVPGSRIELAKTIENNNVYAHVLDLDAGELIIPISYNGETNYISPSDNDGTLKDGETISVTVRENPIPWKIENPGEYRVVIDMQKATATIYSPAKALTPKVVDWNSGAGPVTTEITDLWMHGAINNWGTPIKMNCTVSLADPQVLVYTGGTTGKTKFIAYGGSDNDKNLAYAFSSPLTSAGLRQDITLILGKINDISGGFSGEHRNSYITIPGGTNLLVLDLRNMTILAEKR